MSEQEATLEVSGSYSRCSACHRNADPNEDSHEMTTMVGDGCGARFTGISTGYPDWAESVKAMRPDLPFRGFEWPES